MRLIWNKRKERIKADILKWLRNTPEYRDEEIKKEDVRDEQVDAEQDRSGPLEAFHVGDGRRLVLVDVILVMDALSIVDGPSCQGNKPRSHLYSCVIYLLK